MYYFHWLQAGSCWSITQELISLKQNKSVERRCRICRAIGRILRKRTGGMEASLSGWVVRLFPWLIRCEWFSSGSERLFQSRQTFYILHAAKNTTQHFCSVSPASSVFTDVRTQCANVQMSSAMQNRSKETWRKQHERQRRTFLQSLKHPRVPSTVRTSLHFVSEICNIWTEMTQFMCHKTNGRED